MWSVPLAGCTNIPLLPPCAGKLGNTNAPPDGIVAIVAHALPAVYSIKTFNAKYQINSFHILSFV